MTYGAKVGEDVLKQYPATNVVNVTKVVFSVLVTFSYPLQIHPSRTSWLALWRLAVPSGVAASMDAWDDQQRRVEDRRFHIVTAGLIIGSLAIAIPVKSLGVVLGVV